MAGFHLNEEGTAQCTVPISYAKDLMSNTNANFVTLIGSLCEVTLYRAVIVGSGQLI